MGQVMVSGIHPDTDLLGEPTLDEMLAEPIIRLIMQRDGVNEHDMRSEIDRAQAAYRGMELAQ
jgi:hypothetical protein